MRPVLIFLLMIAFPFIGVSEWILNRIKFKRTPRGTKDGLFDCVILALFMGLTVIGLVIWGILSLF